MSGVLFGSVRAAVVRAAVVRARVAAARARSRIQLLQIQHVHVAPVGGSGERRIKEVTTIFWNVNLFTPHEGDGNFCT